MSLSMFLCGLSVYHEWFVSAFTWIIVMILSFHLLAGGLTWVYVPEVCVDTASGVGIAVQSTNLTIVAFTFDYMINSRLKVYGSLWYFAAFNFVGMLFHIFVVKETRGLTDLQKKTLYTPKDIVEAEVAETEL